MLVKLIAIGQRPDAWQGVLEPLRQAAGQQPFSAAIFSTPQELELLEKSYFPDQWAREAPDLALTQLEMGQEWDRRLAFLKRVADADAEGRTELALGLEELGEGIQRLAMGPHPAAFLLDNGSRFSMTDPGLAIWGFPGKYPRVRLNNTLSGLQLKAGALAPGQPEGLFTVKTLPVGALIHLNQVEWIEDQGERLKPAQWLKEVLKASRARLPAKLPVALYREHKGLFLFPGLPLERVRAVEVGEVHFSHLLDLEALSAGRPEAALGVRRALEGAARRHQEGWLALRRKVRWAENRSDVPVLSGGGNATLSRLMTRLLQSRGFVRAAMQLPEETGVMDEPALLLQLSAPGAAAPRRGVRHLEAPVTMHLAPELEGPLAVLGKGAYWHDLPWREVNECPLDDKLDGPQVGRHLKKMRATLKEAKQIQAETLRALTLLAQEEEVTARARENGGALLLRGGGVRLWDGHAPLAEKALVLSFDREEAAQVMAAMPRIEKKRWLDLSPYQTAEGLNNLDYKTLHHYQEGGQTLITPAALERMTQLHGKLSHDLSEVREAMDRHNRQGGEARLRQARAQAGIKRLAAQWALLVLARWLDEHQERLQDTLDALRVRGERSWFNQQTLSRLAIIGSSQENRHALLEASKQLLPAFHAGESMVVPYDFPEDEKPEGPLFADYLRVVAAEVGVMSRVDLLLIEQTPAVAHALVKTLRHELPSLKNCGVVVVLPHDWLPDENAALPWPRSRVVPIRRLGRLTVAECVEYLGQLFPSTGR